MPVADLEAERAVDAARHRPSVGAVERATVARRVAMGGRTGDATMARKRRADGTVEPMGDEAGVGGAVDGAADAAGDGAGDRGHPVADALVAAVGAAWRPVDGASSPTVSPTSDGAAARAGGVSSTSARSVDSSSAPTSDGAAARAGSRAGAGSADGAGARAAGSSSSPTAARAAELVAARAALRDARTALDRGDGRACLDRMLAALNGVLGGV